VFAILCLTITFVENNLACIFHMHSSVYPSLLCICEPSLSQSFMTF